jgi:hypothetical protein
MKAIVSTMFMVVLCALGTELLGMGTEDFGNAPLGAANYRQWKGVMPVVNHAGRVYHTWVNGNEHFYYQGDTDALNDALRRFAAIEADVREVVLRPGTGETKSFRGKKVTYDWLLHIQGGISRQEEKGTNIWDKHPTMSVFVGCDNVELEKIKIPEGVVVLEVADLTARYLKGLESDDHTVRGYAAYFLAKVDPYNRENAAAVARLLGDEESWVRSMAVGALARFGKQAESALPALRKASQSEQETERISKKCREAIETVENAEDLKERLEERQKMLAKISKFRASLGNDSSK